MARGIAARVFIGFIGVLIAFLAACGASDTPKARDLTVLVGAGQGAVSVNAFLPSTVRIRAGDTVTWRMNADGDPHTVTFTDTPETLIDIMPAPAGSEFELFL
ncbi:MAG: hypothetical protein FJ320_12230 [SAR202 cluster bacterium]|nr:hypothetical protein [SAR202 cluster bacterium]